MPSRPPAGSGRAVYNSYKSCPSCVIRVAPFNVEPGRASDSEQAPTVRQHEFANRRWLKQSGSTSLCDYLQCPLLDHCEVALRIGDAEVAWRALLVWPRRRTK